MDKSTVSNSTEIAKIKGALSSFNFGGSLVEITALTSLIGSTAAESLALGEKGPAGLVWAMMTVFGAIPVVKLFIATSTPGWLRESMGVSNAKSDAVVGLFQNADKNFMFHDRKEPAIAVESEMKSARGSRMKEDSPISSQRRFVYVFNQHTISILNCIPSSFPGDEIKIYSFVEDPWRDKRYASWFSYVDWMLLAASVMGKLGEFTLLWKYDACTLAWVSLASWVFYFTAAVILRLHGLWGNTKKSEIDILTGTLPTCSSVGVDRKIILGIPKSARVHLIWRINWSIGAIIGVSTVVATYVSLIQSTSNEGFLIWAGFQVLWLSIRSAVYYFLSNREGHYHVGLEGRPWRKVNVQDRSRIRRLVYTLSKYQIQQHPRSPLSYEDDIVAPENLENIQSEYPASPEDKNVTLSIQGVIPDTVLSSVSWVFGCKEGGFDFYDTCIIVLKTSNGIISIPAARALSTRQLSGQPKHDSEEGIDLIHLPRGGSLPHGSSAFPDNSIEVKWCYWIPCSGGRWLHFITEQSKNRGQREAAILTNYEVTRILNNGKIMNISLKHVDEVKEIVDYSTIACGHMQALLR
ncbi:hypothetical protein N7509_001955 [Penicillium cosmopolitanum]|uniref:Uncharacterized protein n=1 Tax=Penicillium cosmopolitanum TaxID=1131564 RepID=A0A9X0BCV4_9EURO|nr:uncharacterized protein N7509_001955 [Penicillium cosmopolitanum]KAJ5408072.1 hypothetical protein N7509_001955 [Penicillium cosmopolitanum]